MTTEETPTEQRRPPERCYCWLSGRAPFGVFLFLRRSLALVLAALEVSAPGTQEKGIADVRVP